MNSDNERKIEDCNNELSSIKSWIDNNPLDSNVRFLVAYAVIKASGTIEIILKSIMYAFLADGCKDETQVYLERMIIDSSTNPSTGKIQTLLEQIDRDRKTKFESEITGKQTKADLNSLVKLRNDVAHGRDISASINTVKRYFESGLKMIYFVDSLLMDVEAASLAD